MVTVIINSSFTIYIAFHNFTHGIWAGCVTCTASLEVKLIQQLKSMREEVLFAIFIDLHKVYETLERDSFLEILEVYGMEPWVHRILHAYWDIIRMVDRAGRYYG